MTSALREGLGCDVVQETLDDSADLTDGRADQDSVQAPSLPVDQMLPLKDQTEMEKHWIKAKHQAD